MTETRPLFPADALQALATQIGCGFGRPVNLGVNGSFIDIDTESTEIRAEVTTPYPMHEEFPARLVIWQTITAGKVTDAARYNALRSVNEQAAEALAAVAADASLGGTVSACTIQRWQYHSGVSDDNRTFVEAAYTFRIRRW